MNSSEYLYQGPIDPQFIADTVAKQSSQTDVGGHDLFLGQVRADDVDGKKVSAIDYSAYDEMIDKTVKNIKESIFGKYDQVKSICVKHSVGPVKAGEMSLFVMVSSAHRRQAFEACQEAVELIKFTLPVWKKEVFEDGSHKWVEPEQK